MSCRRVVGVRSEDRTPHRWRVSLREDVFDSFISKGGSTVQKIFGHGSLFSPLLFGKFFDPSDAFPLWDFDSDILLSGIRSSGGCTVDWFATDSEYVLRAELPSIEKYDVEINVENGKVVEMSGLWKRREAIAEDWRSGNWWEFGYARRIELPENANWRKMEAILDEKHYLEIRIPKGNNVSASDIPHSTEVEHN